MSARLHQRGFSYEVALPGEFRPAYLVAFADMGVRARRPSSSVFLLPVQNGKGIPEIAAMLQERGLVILHISDAWPVPGHAWRGPRGRAAAAASGAVRQPPCWALSPPPVAILGFRPRWTHPAGPSSAHGRGHRGREGGHVLVAAADGEAGGLGHFAPRSDQVAQGL